MAGAAAYDTLETIRYYVPEYSNLNELINSVV
jgi:hypothetical protein